MSSVQLPPSSCTRQRGFTRLEFVIVACLFAILFGTYLRAVRYHQERAEAVVVQLTLSNIQMGMAQEWLQRLTQGKNRDDVAALVGTNPIRWLETPPVGYLGELKNPKLDRLEPGVWFFELNSKELVYVPRQSSYLDLGPMPMSQPALRWSVKLAHNPEVNTPEFGDLRLQAVQPYQWF